MSPTSYQTAPPRDLMITTVLLSVKLARGPHSPKNAKKAALSAVQKSGRAEIN